jgi:hypothetical protein
MSDIQDLIHTQTVKAYESGVNHEQQRIITLLTNRYAELIKANHWAESNHYLEIVTLIKGQTK